MTTPTRFAYRAARADGATETGEVAAVNRDAAVSALTNRGLWPMDVHVRRSVLGTRAGIPTADLALGIRVLATLLDSGLPIGKSLAAMPELAPRSWASALPEMEQGVREGASLAAVLERSALAVPPVVIGMIRAGEAGSGLAAAVRRAATLMEEAAATRRAIRAALVYPIVLAAAGTASVAVLVSVVLPRFAAILGDIGQTLPASTRLVLFASHVVRAGSLPAALSALIIWATWRAWVQTSTGAERWHAWLLKLPFVGGVRRSASTARACAALGALLESGVPLSIALTHGARASGDAAISARILAARAAIIAGARPSAALGDTSAITGIATRLVRAGEETGSLAAMFAHAAKLEAERATERVRAAVRLLEPGLILVFGAMVALVAAALLQAIYSVRPT
ncbi:MAG TPA: type II secretion system F family protein [Gemmatimonadaceae bacterium]|nr:type II secretion system F family protein [Gemmatimonadaceae bacterium]